MIHLKKGLEYMHSKSEVPHADEFAKFCCKTKPNKLSFSFQDGTIKDVGVNGVQISDILYFMYGTMASLNGHYPCHENLVTLDALEHAITAQQERTTNRLMRGVEGSNNA